MSFQVGDKVVDDRGDTGVVIGVYGWGYDVAYDCGTRTGYNIRPTALSPASTFINSYPVQPASTSVAAFQVGDEVENDYLGRGTVVADGGHGVFCVRWDNGGHTTANTQGTLRLVSPASTSVVAVEITESWSYADWVAAKAVKRCECGAHATRNPNLHATYCPLHESGGTVPYVRPKVRMF